MKKFNFVCTTMQKEKAIVISASNLDKVTILLKSMQGANCIPVVYKPKTYRPPVDWYKEMGYPVDRHPENRVKSKPGPKAGSGSRPERLNFRCSEDLLQTIEFLKLNVEQYKKMSTADLIDEIIINHYNYLSMIGAFTEVKIK